MMLPGKIVIVTGGAGSLGSACARSLADEGAAVVVTDLPGTAVGDIVAEIVTAGGLAIAHQGDLRDEGDITALVEATRIAFGEADVLVNNAAAIGQTALDRTLDTMTTAYWDDVMAINVRGAMLCAKHVIPGMLAKGAGVILNFGSTAAVRGDNGLIAYSTTKAALLGFTRAIATTYGKAGIRCNAVCPGSAYSPGIVERMGAERADLMQRTRLTPRLGTAQDVADTVCFLASDKAAYITGQSFFVDGGGIAHQPWVAVK